jgi:DNA-binding transcriptional ArsR family regulator
VTADYDLDDIVYADTPERVRAVTDPVRNQVLDLVLERAASVTELASALGRPKSSVAHHVDVLVGAGLLRIVRTRRVRAVEERFYGRVARRIVIGTSGLPEGAEPPNFLAEAIAESAEADPARVFATIRHARIPAVQAEAFFARLAALADEFSELPRGGDIVHGLVAAIYPTSQPSLRKRGRQPRRATSRRRAAPRRS